MPMSDGRLKPDVLQFLETSTNPEDFRRMHARKRAHLGGQNMAPHALRLALHVTDAVQVLRFVRCIDKVSSSGYEVYTGRNFFFPLDLFICFLRTRFGYKPNTEAGCQVRQDMLNSGIAMNISERTWPVLR